MVAPLRIVDAEADRRVLEERRVVIVGGVVGGHVEDELVAARQQPPAQQRADPSVRIGLGLGQQLWAAVVAQPEERNREPRGGLSALKVQDVGADGRLRPCQRSSLRYAWMMMPDAPLARTARFDILHAGSLDPGVTSTCSLVRDGDRLIVFDPGMVERQADLLDPLRALGFDPGAVTDVVLSHHHPDHTINVALFPNARVHDHWAIYLGADWDSVDCEGRQLGPSTHLIRVPGHSAEDIALVVGTPETVIVCTHLWWTAEGPADDPYAPDEAVLHASRSRVLALADVVVPGHGEPFRPGPDTPS